MISYLLPKEIVYAHCDGPCGIYDPKQAQIYAQAIVKMVEKIDALPNKSIQTVDDQNNFVRYVLIKEEQARKCKEEILILWTDYFKSEHIKMFPELHDIVWNAAKLCSENKQHVSKVSAQQLVDKVNTIADIFSKTKAAK